jgi:hypothetical protein
VERDPGLAESAKKADTAAPSGTVSLRVLPSKKTASPHMGVGPVGVLLVIHEAGPFVVNQQNTSLRLEGDPK